MSRARLLPLLTALTLSLSLAACGREPGKVQPLLDGDHAPDILVEAHDVERPPSLGGNRFLSGWWPFKRGKQVILQPLARARLQIVHLGPSTAPRTLALDLFQPPPPGLHVRVTAAGRDLGSFPVADPLEIPLPADLPEGRINVDLAFDPGVTGVRDAAVRPSLPTGSAVVQGADLVQTGESRVDLYARVASGDTLVGRFDPPASPEPGQRFELTVEREDGTTIRSYAWSPSRWNRLLGERGFEMMLRDADGFVRIRLRARGTGEPGRWRGLGLRHAASSEIAAPSPEKAPASNAAPPRLVVLYVMDALRADTVGFLGGPPGISPNYDRLAQEGMAFRDHRSVAPNTLPSTKALFTGHPFVARGGWKLDPATDGPALPELFHAAGYKTGLFSGNVYISPAYGMERGFDHTADEVLIDDYSAVDKPPFNDNAARAHAAALAWLATLPRGSKAFLYLHVIHPHNPYDPPEPFLSRYTAGIPSTIDGSSETLADIKQKRRTTTPADRRRLRGLYNASFSYDDAELAGFLKGLAAWAPPSETLVVLTADHGEEHFDHGGVLHGFTVYEEQLRIPLVIWGPGRIRPAMVDARTDSLDLHATLLGLCGLHGKTTGRPLLAVASGETGDYVHLAAASSVKGGIFSALHGRWKVVWAPRTGPSWGQGDSLGRSREPEYLFDLQQDPRERINLAGEGDFEAAWLRSRLIAWASHRNEGGKKGGEAPVDARTLERLKALGYAND
jgi:arylsulfatase A-like enzyme